MSSVCDGSQVRHRAGRWWLIFVCAVVCAAAAPAGAQAAKASVSGSGALTNEGLHLEISASANANHPRNAVKGTFHAFRVDVPFDNFDISGPVECVRVAGNTAYAGGQITSGGDSFVFFKIVANEPPALQQVTIYFTGEDAARDCTFDPDTLPWDVGNFTVSGG
jgi:hypothetical protein